MKQKDLWRRANPDRPLGSRVGPPGEVLSLLLLAATLTIITQWTAHSLGFHPVLGPPLATLGDPRVWRLLATIALAAAGLFWWRWPEQRDPRKLSTLLGGVFAFLGTGPLFLPHMFIVWWIKLRHDPVLGEFFVKRALWGSLIFVLLAVAVFARRSRQPRGRTAPDLAGSAEWATTEDLEAAGLLDQTSPGVVLGQWKGKRWIRDCGPHHLFVQGGARSGKGVGIVVPTALTWPGTLVYSGKFAEIEGLTRGYRQSLGPVWSFSPTGYRDRYNPLGDLREEPFLEAEIEELAASIARPRSDRQEDVWSRGGTQLLAALMHYAVSEGKPTLAYCRRVLATGIKGLELLEDHADPRISEYPKHLMSLADRTRASFVSAAMDGLAPFVGKALSHATSGNDFTVDTLLFADKPATLYLDTSSDSIGARSALRLVLRQLLKRITSPENLVPDRKGGPMRTRLTHKVLFLLDEFPLFGKIDIIGDKLEEVPGYGARFVFVVQNLPRHLKEWGEPGTQIDPIFAGCQMHVTYGGTDPQTCKVFSEILGKTTEHYTVRSDRREVFEVLDRNIQNAPHLAARELLTADELRRLPAGQVVIVPRGARPAMAEHVKFYEDGELRRRSLLPRADPLKDREVALRSLMGEVESPGEEE